MPTEVSGAVEVRVPGDKSITHRALILAALSSGTSVLRDPLVGADTRSSAAALRELGCDVDDLGAVTHIRGRGLRGLRAPRNVLDCGNSGTTARLLMGALAGCAFDATLSGDGSLRSRPMRRVIEPLALMGATFDELERPDRLPVRMRGGALRPLEYESPHASAQVKSAVLLAGLTGSADVQVREPVLSRDHTERMLERLGVRLRRETRQSGEAVVTMSPAAELPPFEMDVPGDISSAAFIAVLACLAEAGARPVRIARVGLNPTRTGFLNVLMRMNAQVTVENERESCGEPVGDVVIRSSRLTATRVTPGEVPSLIDELPAIAVLAARAEGITVVEGAAELRVKESDRIHAIVSNLMAIGVHAEERADGFVVHGSGARLAGRVRSWGDHRIAMAFAALAAAGAPEVDVDDMSSAGVSFPGFEDLLRDLVRRVKE